jgi:hypothetical protein
MTTKPDYKAVALQAVDLLCRIGYLGLDASKQRQLWQEALDLDRRLHPDRPPIVVWTAEEGDVDPPRSPGVSPRPAETTGYHHRGDPK